MDITPTDFFRTPAPPQRTGAASAGREEDLTQCYDRLGQLADQLQGYAAHIAIEAVAAGVTADIEESINHHASWIVGVSMQKALYHRADRQGRGGNKAYYYSANVLLQSGELCWKGVEFKSRPQTVTQVRDTVRSLAGIQPFTYTHPDEYNELASQLNRFAAHYKLSTRAIPVNQ